MTNDPVQQAMIDAVYAAGPSGLARVEFFAVGTEALAREVIVNDNHAAMREFCENLQEVAPDPVNYPFSNRLTRFLNAIGRAGTLQQDARTKIAAGKVAEANACVDEAVGHLAVARTLMKAGSLEKVAERYFSDLGLAEPCDCGLDLDGQHRRVRLDG